MTYLIRPMRDDDLYAVLSILIPAKMSMFITPELFPQIRASNPSLCLLAEHEGAVIATAFGSVDSVVYGNIRKIAVDPQYRKQGIGRTLVETLLGEFRAQGVRQVSCRIAPTNDASQALFRSFGFDDATKLDTYRLNL